MSTEIRKNLPVPVLELRARVDDWRSNRNGQRHMPRELWEAAVKLAKRYGISPVSAGLALGYMSLKQKVHGQLGAREKEVKDSRVCGGCAAIDFCAAVWFCK